MSPRKLSSKGRTSGRSPRMSGIRITAKRVAALSVAAAGACVALMVAAGPADAKVDPGSPADTTIPLLPPVPPPDYRPPPPPHAAAISQTGLDAESAGIGLLGGLALGAAGVGVTYAVRRRLPSS